VLTDLLAYFEKDEARHVGLGTQVLPIMMRGMTRLEGARLSAFALRVTFWLIASNAAMQEPLRQLGLDPRRVLQLAKSKQMIVWQELFQSTQKVPTLGDALARIMEAVANAAWPPPGQTGITGRSRAFVSGLVTGVDEVPTSIQPD